MIDNSNIAKRDQFIDTLLSRMTLEQKVGGCLIMDWMGTVVPPYVHRLVRDFHLAGLRVDTTIRGKPSYVDDVKDPEARRKLSRGNRAPAGVCRDFLPNLPAPFCAPAQYAAMGNALRRLALQRPLAIPVHMTLDQEGNGNENYTLGDVRLFPSQMGLAASGDESLVYRAALALGRQLRSAGLNWIHSPVVDVNTNPANPEINTRAFSDDPQVVARHALAMVRGFTDAGIIATAKHYPGRGESASDAHHGLPVCDISRQELWDVHLLPYRTLIPAGLPSIMTAHTVYPAIDPDECATLSRKVITGLLREELGFDGVVTTDNMTMGGIVAQYEVPEACIRALNAGVDLLLVRSESPLCEEVFRTLVKAAKEKAVAESRLDEANRRILRLKWRFGLFENGGLVEPAAAEAPQHEPEAIRIEQLAAEKAAVVRDRGGLLPLRPGTRVLLVEQAHVTHTLINNQACHASVFWENMLAIDPAVGSVEIGPADEKALGRVLRRVHEADVVVATNYVSRRSDQDIAPFIRQIMAGGKPVIVVTNSPYRFGSPEDFPAVICVFCANPASLRVAAEIIYGRRNPEGKLPLRRTI